jgi:hypothetical protein
MKDSFDTNSNFIFYHKGVDFFQIIDLKLMVMILISKKD